VEKMRWVKFISDAIEKVFISFFYYLGYRGFVSRVPATMTAAIAPLIIFPASGRG